LQLQLKQTVWVQCYPTTQNQIGFGAIYKFFDTEDGPAFQFYDEINGGFRIGLVKDIIEKFEHITKKDIVKIAQQIFSSKPTTAMIGKVKKIQETVNFI
jgi:predicted Zn-dependent peptidase